MKITLYHAPYFMLNHASWVRMMLSVDLAQRFDFNPATLYIPVLRPQRRTLLFNRILHINASHPTFVHYNCQIPISFTRATRAQMD